MYELTKPRLSLLSVFTASLGYLVREPLRADLSIFISLTIGTALAAGGAAALNQWMERQEDALMARTASRPLPAGLISPEFAVSFGILLSSLGIYILWTGTNPWAATLTLATLAVYLLLYTPMKKRSPYAIESGRDFRRPPPPDWLGCGRRFPHHLRLDIIWYSYLPGNSPTLWRLPGTSGKITPRVGLSFINWEIPTENPWPVKA